MIPIPDQLVDTLIELELDEFLPVRAFTRDIAAGFMAAGFLVMAGKFEGTELLLPKFHLTRMVINPSWMKPGKTVRKRSFAYRFSVNRAFDQVLTECVAVHGDDWLRPGLAAWMEIIHRQPVIVGNPSVRVQALSCEIWQDDTLCAGEVGILCGNCYTSYSGFTRISGAGTVQLYSLARWLRSAGIHMWDLGMEMEYKSRLGAKALTRTAFASQFRSARFCPMPQIGLWGPQDAADLLYPE